MFVTICSIKDRLFETVAAACQELFGNSNAWRVENGVLKVYYKDITQLERFINRYDLGV